jgi:deazaflavin-dependent oxidoreductase (nitroreductase family)
VGLYSRFMLATIRRAEVVPLLHNVLVPLDRRLFKLTKGRASLAHFGRDNSQVMQNLLLTTTGRRSGKPRATPLLYLDHDGGYVIVGSRYGTDKHPLWTLNLAADPHAKVIVRGVEHEVDARRLTPEELHELWPRLVQLYPAWQDYRERTDREFRAFHLSAAR